ncbi:hypothetical protein [Alicyclobacillus kakegawensis]|uniref:hypothetical protein n=1 Tax=Alicyclobacillus kakegawensis TaxID=392012 RepID=UPI000AC64522|nr:hypothetical protein [Alicyclobacillus kakegawensis]
MQLQINDKTYDVDVQELANQWEPRILEWLNAPESEFHRFEGAIRSLGGMILAYLAMKHPELKRPDGVDTLTHLVRLALAGAVTQLEKQPITLTAKEVQAS